MNRAYYIESKSYWKDVNGTDHQVPDGGDLPILYSSKRQAIKRINGMIKVLTETMGYLVIIPNERYPGVGEHYHYACRLQKSDPQVRLEIRLYTIDIY